MLLRKLLAPSVVAVVALAPVAPAGAADAAGSGWWTTSPVALAPDANGGLVVQGGAQVDQPVSYAAVQFTLAPGESAARLSLTTASGSASTPNTTLTVCPLTGSFTPADGGAMADAPRYDCTASKVSSPAANGVYSFDLAALPASRTLALAVLPGAAGDRVVLAKPGSDALQTNVASTPTGGDTPAATEPTTSFDIPSLPPPVVDPLPAVAVAPAANTTVVPSASRVVAVAPPTADGTKSGGGSPSGAAVLVVLLALAAAGLWVAAGHIATGADAGEG